MSENYLVPIFLSASVLIALFAFFVVLYVLIQKHKQNLYHLEKEKMIFNHQNKILNNRIEEQERVLGQLSKEIHDNLGQQANFAEMNLITIAQYASDQKQQMLIESTRQILDGIVKDIRNISHSLNNEFIQDIGLINMLQEELNYINLNETMKGSLDIEGEDRMFPPQSELLIYRIAQEAIHNISKHAKATQIDIVLTYAPEYFSMVISDNGVGFDKSVVHELKGTGFLNMFHRAKLLNSCLNIDSTPDGGSTITLIINNVAEFNKNEVIPQPENDMNVI